MLQDESCAGLGTFDVTDYYHSIDIDELARQLVGAPSGALDALVEMLNSLPDLGGVEGLPIGFEGSAPLGNVYLLPADDVWRDQRLGLIRWTDDSWLFLRDAKEWPAALAEYADRLTRLGLRLNAEKSHFHEKFLGFPEEVISNGLIDSITSRPDGRVPPDEARDLLLRELDEADPDQNVVGFAISCLRSSRPSYCATLVVDHPELWRLAPKATGDLLVTAAKDPVARRRIRPDWLADLVADDAGKADALAGRLHAARVAAHVRPGRSDGARLFDVVTSKETPVPLRAGAARAWEASDHWRPGRAVEAALEASHLNLRRSLVAGFKNRAGHRSQPRDWKRLRHEDPDLSPTLAWAAA